MRTATLFVTVLSLSMSNFLAISSAEAASPSAVSPANALKAIEATEEVKAIYGVYMKRRATGVSDSCPDCAPMTVAQQRKAEASKIQLKKCENPSGSLTYCEGTVSKTIFLKGGKVATIVITSNLTKDDAGNINVYEINNIALATELND